jgi:tubulysin polyketide synthase-like protein
MNANEILAELGARNVRPVLVGDKLKLRGSADGITPELIERVRQHKADLLALLIAGREETEIDRLANADGWRSNPAESLERLRERPTIGAAATDMAPIDRATSHTESEQGEANRPATIDGWRLPPAHSIVATCHRYGVALRIDEATGDLVIGKSGAKADERTQPWPSLLMP